MEIGRVAVVLLFHELVEILFRLGRALEHKLYVIEGEGVLDRAAIVPRRSEGDHVTLERCEVIVVYVLGDAPGSGGLCQGG
jgi:hypothetical protein